MNRHKALECSMCHSIRAPAIDQGPALPEPERPTPLDLVEGVLQDRPTKKPNAMPNATVKAARIGVDTGGIVDIDSNVDLE